MMNVIVAKKERSALANAIPLQTIQEALRATLITRKLSTNRLVKVACASDLMSDVLAYSQPGSLLLTSLVSPQAIRTAEVADIMAICFVFGKEPSADMISLAEEGDIPLLVSKYSLYCASGKLYEIGLAGCLQCDD